MAGMPMPGLVAGGAAATDLGLGNALSDQVKDETDEQRKKRIQQMQQQQLAGSGGSLAANSIFGGIGGPGY